MFGILTTPDDEISEAMREVIADTRDAIGDRCALAVRLAVDELLGEGGFQHGSEGRDVIAALAEEPDLWDVNVSGWSNSVLAPMSLKITAPYGARAARGQRPSAGTRPDATYVSRSTPRLTSAASASIQNGFSALRWA